MKRLVLSALVVALFTGCGPHKISAQEQARQKAAETRKHEAQKRADAAAKERKRIDDLKKTEAERNGKIIAYNVAQFKLQPLPTGVHQIGSYIFIADVTAISHLRSICSGHYDDGSDSVGNDVEKVSIHADGRLQVNCKGAQRRFRDEAWEASYEKSVVTHTVMPGLEGK